MTETERQADIMRREVRRQCLDCGEVHQDWHKDELLNTALSAGAWGICYHCYDTRITGPLPLKNAPPLLQNRKGPAGVNLGIDADGRQIDRSVSAVEGQEAGAQ